MLVVVAVLNENPALGAAAPEVIVVEGLAPPPRLPKPNPVPAPAAVDVVPVVDCRGFTACTPVTVDVVPNENPPGAAVPET